MARAQVIQGKIIDVGSEDFVTAASLYCEFALIHI